MDFTFTEEQETISKLARELFDRRATPERLTELEAGDTRYDAALWKELAARRPAGHRVAGVGGRQRRWLRGTRGAAGRGGASVAPVPAYPTLVLGADPIARHGSPEQQQRFLPGVIDGTRILSAGLQEPGRSDPTQTRPPPPVATARTGGWTAPKSWCRPPSSPTPC